MNTLWIVDERRRPTLTYFMLGLLLSTGTEALTVAWNLFAYSDPDTLFDGNYINVANETDQ
jgi:hypothetical protein